MDEERVTIAVRCGPVDDYLACVPSICASGKVVCSRDANDTPGRRVVAISWPLEFDHVFRIDWIASRDGRRAPAHGCSAAAATGVCS